MVSFFWLGLLFASFYATVKIILRYLKLSHDRYWKNLGVPTVEVKISLLDRLLERKTFMEIEEIMLSELRDRNLGYAGVTELGQRVFVVRDQELSKTILVKDADIWINRRSIPMTKSDPVLGKMLIFLEGQEWRSMRGLLSPNFSTGKIKRMFDRVEDCSQMLMNQLNKDIGDKDQKEIEVRDVVSSFTMDVIASTFFGIEVDTIKNRDAPFAQMGRLMQKSSPSRLIKFLIMLAAPKLANNLRIRFFQPESTDFFYRVVKETIAYREKNNISRQDFLQLLIEHKNAKMESKIEIDDDDIAAQAVLFLLGGFDTVETVLSFTIYELALHPEIQDRIYEEVTRVLEKHGGKVCYEAVNELEYCDRVISETMRMYPPAARLERRNTQDYTIPGSNVTLPKDSIIAFPVYAFHRDPEFFPDPLKFDPDRFLNKEAINSYTYLPFGQGIRNCIGMRFAQVEMRSVLAHLILNFRLEPTERTQIPLELTMSSGNNKPKGPVHLKLTKRN